MRYRMATSIVLGAMLLSAAAWAHHNMSALFDFNNRVTLTGTLSKVDWRNPHIELTVDRKADGDQAETWSIEGPSPSFFRTHDISRSDFDGAVGQTVTAEASRARDGSRSGLMRTLSLPNGKVISACPQNC
jgi:hypothetical protein